MRVMKMSCVCNLVRPALDERYVPPTGRFFCGRAALLEPYMLGIRRDVVNDDVNMISFTHFNTALFAFLTFQALEPTVAYMFTVCPFPWSRRTLGDLPSTPNKPYHPF